MVQEGGCILVLLVPIHQVGIAMTLVRHRRARLLQSLPCPIFSEGDVIIPGSHRTVSPVGYGLRRSRLAQYLLGLRTMLWF